VDGAKVIPHRSDGQGARKRYRKRDGSWVIAVELEPGVIEFGRLIAVRDRDVFDAYEDALARARAALRTGVDAGDAHNALAAFEATVDAALALLREALKS
jgi:predicted RNase H-like HicB family nuclease